MKRWQFWNRRKRPELKEAFLAGKKASEEALKEQIPPPQEEPTIPSSFRFAKEPVQKTARFAKEPEFSVKPEWKATRTAKDHSQKTKSKLSHWSHRMTVIVYEHFFLEAVKIHITRISIFLQTKNAQTRTDS